MRDWKWFVVAGLAGCSTGVGTPQSGSSALGDIPSVVHRGFQYDGSMVFLRDPTMPARARINPTTPTTDPTTDPALGTNGTSTMQAGNVSGVDDTTFSPGSTLLATTVPPILVEISAPIMPTPGAVDAFFQTANHASLGEQRMIADKAAMPFRKMLAGCATKYNEIVLSSSELSNETLAANYEAVARCAGDGIPGRADWAPMLVGNVDICADTLGADWRLISTDDLRDFGEGDYATLQNMIGAAAGARQVDSSSVYFSLSTYVRDAAGQLRIASLNAGEKHVKAFGEGGDDPSLRLGKVTGLRCIRTGTAE